MPVAFIKCTRTGELYHNLGGILYSITPTMAKTLDPYYESDLEMIDCTQSPAIFGPVAEPMTMVAVKAHMPIILATCIILIAVIIIGIIVKRLMSCYKLAAKCANTPPPASL